MKKYSGIFKDKTNTDVLVEITPYMQSYTEEVEIRFPFDEPVIIETTTSKVFDSVRTISCTIKIFSDEIYWDLYTPSATGYKVSVVRLTGKIPTILFDGFLTPCVYTQDYLYKSEIELEAVDYLAVLEQFKYKTKLPNETDIISVHELLNQTYYKSIFKEDAPDNLWYDNYTDFDFTKYYIQESNFFDDDGEAMTCKEILEELFNYLGCSVIYHNGKLTIFDVKTNSTKETLDLTKYGDDNPTVELDEVYNKITIGCNLYEVDKLTTDFFDDEESETIFNEVKKTSVNNSQIYSNYYFSWREHGHHTEDKNRYYLYIKPYQFVDESIDDSVKGNWSNSSRLLSNLALTTDTSLQKATNNCSRYVDSQGNKLYVAHYTGAQPIRVFQYTEAEGLSSKKDIRWNDYIIFPSVNWTTREQRFERTVYPALSYKSNDNLAYSIQDGTGYIVIDLSVFCQSDIGIKGVDTDVIWAKAYRNGIEETVAVPLPMDNVGLTFNEDSQEFTYRKSDDSNYNKGWEFIKVKVKVGNKYWNGSEWTETNSTFNLSFHDTDAGGNDEKFSYFKWLQVVPNQSIPQYTVGEDGYAIPITAGDALNGKFELEIYTPEPIKIPHESSYGQLVYDYMRTCNNYFVKDLSVKYVYKDSHHWADDKEIEDDIIYENIINDDYATEMDELDLKINSWYKDKPISKSYLLNENKLPITKIDGRVQEERLLEKYYNHYSTPKKIFNLNYKSLDVNPIKTFYHEQTATNYNIMSYRMNVKSNETDYKLIEI